MRPALQTRKMKRIGCEGFFCNNPACRPSHCHRGFAHLEVKKRAYKPPSSLPDNAFIFWNEKQSIRQHLLYFLFYLNQEPGTSLIRRIHPSYKHALSQGTRCHGHLRRFYRHHCSHSSSSSSSRRVSSPKSTERKGGTSRSHGNCQPLLRRLMRELCGLFLGFRFGHQRLPSRHHAFKIHSSLSKVCLCKIYPSVPFFLLGEKRLTFFQWMRNNDLER